MEQGYCLKCNDTFGLQPKQAKAFPFCPYCDIVVNGPIADEWIPVLSRNKKQPKVIDEENP
jgi:hypothetical protein